MTLKVTKLLFSFVSLNDLYFGCLFAVALLTDFFFFATISMIIILHLVCKRKRYTARLCKNMPFFDIVSVMKDKKPRKSCAKIIKYIILTILVGATVFCFWFFLLRDETKTAKTTDNNDTSTVQSKKDNIIHFAAMGDMMAHDTIIANAKTGSSYDFAKYFKNIRSSYQDADVVFCDQEGLSSGDSYVISGYPAFNAPTKYSADLQSGAGCNMINLANNHMGDKGVSATNATIDNWASLKPLLISGANKSVDAQNTVSYATVNNIKIGYVSFADFNNNSETPSYSINLYSDENLVKSLVTQARSNADVVIVSMHWGVEDSAALSEDQRNAADLVSSLGADVIIGTGPHVLQPVHTVARPDGGKTVIWYSLGNMLSSQLTIQELVGGIAQFDIIKGDDGKISVENLSFTPTYMHYEWTADQAATSDYLARKNAMIYLLSDAAVPLSKSLFNTTIAEQKQYVIDALGSEVTVK